MACIDRFPIGTKIIFDADDVFISGLNYRKPLNGKYYTVVAYNDNGVHCIISGVTDGHNSRSSRGRTIDHLGNSIEICRRYEDKWNLTDSELRKFNIYNKNGINNKEIKHLL